MEPCGHCMDFGFYSEEGGKTLEDLRRGVIESNILDNNSDCHVENRLKGDDQDASAHIQVGDDAGSDGGSNGSGRKWWIYFGSKAKRIPDRWDEE